MWIRRLGATTVGKTIWWSLVYDTIEFSIFFVNKVIKFVVRVSKIKENYVFVSGGVSRNRVCVCITYSFHVFILNVRKFMFLTWKRVCLSDVNRKATSYQ